MDWKYVIGIISTVALFIWIGRKLMGLFSKKQLETLPQPAITYNELKKRIRIIVIDDDKESFPIEILKDEGYAIDYWAEVQSLSKLEDGYYDIIFLDIKGITKKYHTPNEGIDILKHIKKENPSQIVVAFSGHSFDLSKSEFWKIADDTLAKPVTAIDCKEKIDELIKKFITPHYFWLAINNILQQHGVKEKQIRRIEHQLVKAIESKNDSNLKPVIESVIDDVNMTTRVINMAFKIVGLFK